MQRVKGVGASTSLGGKLEPLGVNNGLQVENCAFKQLIDYNEVEFPGLGHFYGSVFQPQLYDVSAVFAAPLQARAQLLPARRENENKHGIGKRL